jgi:hypothetical protein
MMRIAGRVSASRALASRACGWTQEVGRATGSVQWLGRGDSRGVLYVRAADSLGGIALATFGLPSHQNGTINALLAVADHIHAMVRLILLTPTQHVHAHSASQQPGSWLHRHSMHTCRELGPTPCGSGPSC